MFGGVGGKACWASLGRVLVDLGESGCFVVDIFKVEMDGHWLCSIGEEAPAELEEIT